MRHQYENHGWNLKKQNKYLLIINHSKYSNYSTYEMELRVSYQSYSSNVTYNMAMTATTVFSYIFDKFVRYKLQKTGYLLFNSY